MLEARSYPWCPDIWALSGALARARGRSDLLVAAPNADLTMGNDALTPLMPAATAFPVSMLLVLLGWLCVLLLVSGHHLNVLVQAVNVSCKHSPACRLSMGPCECIGWKETGRCIQFKGRRVHSHAQECAAVSSVLACLPALK